MDKSQRKRLASKLCGLLICNAIFARQTRVKILDAYYFARQGANVQGTSAQEAMTDGHSTTDRLLTDIEYTFAVTLDAPPNYVTTQIDAQIQHWPRGVRFISSKLLPITGTANSTASSDANITDIKNKRSNTVVSILTLVLCIDTAGDYILPSVPITLHGKIRHIAFPHIHAVQNPDTAIPALSIAVEDTVSKRQITIDSDDNRQGILAVPVGRKIRLTLSARFTKQIDSVNWNIPKDAILQEEHEKTSIQRNALMDTTDTASYGNSENDSDANVPASFIWQPLVAGRVPLPIITCNAVAINGKPTTLTTPVAYLTVFESTQEDKPYADNMGTIIKEINSANSMDERDAGTSLFPTAFDMEDNADGTDCNFSSNNTAKLRKNMNNYVNGATILDATDVSMLPSEVATSVASLKSLRTLGRTAHSMSVIIAILTAIVAVIGWIMRRKALSICFASTSFCSLSIAILCTIVFLSAHGVFTGEMLHSIPDENSSTIALNALTIVQITDEVADVSCEIMGNAPESYLYVKSKSVSGWAKCKDVVVVR